jgi:hypothetical protein
VAETIGWTPEDEAEVERLADLLERIDPGVDRALLLSYLERQVPWTEAVAQAILELADVKRRLAKQERWMLGARHV